MVETIQGNKSLKLTWDNLNRLIQSDHNGRITRYGYDVFGRRLYKKSQDAKGRESLTLFGWDGDLMIWESKTIAAHKAQNSQEDNHNKQDYTKHYIYEPNSFVPALQAGYSQFIKLIDTPDYSRFKTEPNSIYKDPVWKTETRKQRTELERVAFYHCDQVGTPQSLSNELGECVWSIRQSTWGRAEEISQQDPDNPFEQTEIRFQGQYYDEETGLHYNRYRYYEPHSARYISKNPIGLQSGLNNSAYVKDTNLYVDPLGLVQWTGSAYQVSAALASGGNFTLTSECKGGKKVKVEIYSGGIGLSKGLSVGAFGMGSVTFEDGLQHIDPEVFNGDWVDRGIAVSVVKGISIGTTQIGKAKSVGWYSWITRGYAGAIGVTGGEARVTNRRVESCVDYKCDEACKSEIKKRTEESKKYPKPDPINIPPSSQWFNGL